MLQEIVPGLRRVAYPCPTAELKRCFPLPEWFVKSISPMGVAFEMSEVTGPEAFDAFFERAKRAGAEAVFVPPMAWFVGYQRELGEAAARTPLPVIFDSQIFVESGGLIGYTPEITHPGQRTAAIVARILEGGDPGEIPVEQPTLFDLWLNLKTARTWGIKIPPSLLVQAAGVVE